MDSKMAILMDSKMAILMDSKMAILMALMRDILRECDWESLMVTHSVMVTVPMKDLLTDQMMETSMEIHLVYCSVLRRAEMKAKQMVERKVPWMVNRSVMSREAQLEPLKVIRMENGSVRWTVASLDH